jgi:hypothetical protein
VVVALMLVWKEAYAIPPIPAIAAETAKSASFTVRGEIPEVEAPTSDDLTAAMLRPHDERCRLLMSSITTSTTTSRLMAIVRLSVRWSGPILGRGRVHPDWLLVSHFHWNRTLSPRRARASVARASCRPPRRRAGRAMTNPNATAARTPMAAAPKNGMP